MSLKPNIQNPYFSGRTPELETSEEIAPAVQVLPSPGDQIKVRHLTFSPREEFAARDGNTEKLDHEFIAMLCGGWHGIATCTLNGILLKTAELVGVANRLQGIRYWHPDSNLCNQLADGNKKVLYTYNPSRPEMIHLHTLDGRYLETLPQRNRPGIMDNTALAKDLADQNRQIQRAANRLQDLQQETTNEAICTATRNASEMDRVATTMALPDHLQPKPAADSSTGRIAAEIRKIEEEQAHHRSIDHTREKLIHSREIEPAEIEEATTFDPYS